MTTLTAPATERLTRPTVVEHDVVGSPYAVLLAKPTMSVTEMATVLGVGRNASYRLVREGQVRVLRVGRRIRVPTAAVRELLGQ